VHSRQEWQARSQLPLRALPSITATHELVVPKSIPMTSPPLALRVCATRRARRGVGSERGRRHRDGRHTLPTQRPCRSRAPAGTATRGRRWCTALRRGRRAGESHLKARAAAHSAWAWPSRGPPLRHSAAAARRIMASDFPVNRTGCTGLHAQRHNAEREGGGLPVWGEVAVQKAFAKQCARHYVIEVQTRWKMV
jgi:hypothetical protein